MFQKYQKYIIVFITIFMISLTGGGAVQAQSSKHLVVIDPAHGGTDIGVIGADKVEEKEIALAIALFVQKELAKESNLEVVLTRNADKTVSLEERRKNIAKMNPAMVLSLHCNAGFGKKSSGYELYYPGFKNLESTPKEARGAAGNAQETRYLNDAVKLARLVQKNLDVLFPRKNRGLREAGVPLAEGLSVPLLIVEIGFATNPDEKKKLTSVKSQAEIARALAKSIKAFF